MTVDRYTKGVLTVIAVALTVIAAGLWLGPLGPQHWITEPEVAETQTGPPYETVIPKAWGKLVGYNSGNLLIEAADGTLREVDVRGEAPEYPRIKTVVRWK